MENTDIVDLRGIAILLGKSKHTPNQWRQRGILPPPDFNLLRPVWKKSTIIRWAKDTGRWPPERTSPTTKTSPVKKQQPKQRPTKPASNGFKTQEDRAAEIPPAIFRPPPDEPLAA